MDMHRFVLQLNTDKTVLTENKRNFDLKKFSHPKNDDDVIILEITAVSAVVLLNSFWKLAKSIPVQWFTPTMRRQLLNEAKTTISFQLQQSFF